MIDQRKDKDLPECKICGLKAENLSIHVSRIHGMKVADYHAKFGTSSKDLLTEELRQTLSDNFSGEKNPGFQHGGTMSPFSTKNLKIANLSDEEKAAWAKANSDKYGPKSFQPHQRSMCIEYYLHKGMSQEDAEAAVKERQTTFSLEKCKIRYGKEEGTKVWQNRQEKWQNTLLSKSKEEIQEINKKKMSGCVSKISQELFESVSENIEDCHFHNKNGEFRVKGVHGYYQLDFVSSNKVIEFYGDFWHANPRKYHPDDLLKILHRGNNRGLLASEIWAKDLCKINDLASIGYDVLIVWEHDFRKDKKGITQKCIDFLKG